MARSIDGASALRSVIKEISSNLEEILRKEITPISPIRVVLNKPFDNPVAVEDDSTLLNRCEKLDPVARRRVIKLIYDQLFRHGLKVRTLNAILSQYYINYFGEPSDITTSTKRIGLNKIRRILIDKDAEYEVKLMKLAQVVYQEAYGMSVVDEFIYMAPENSDDTKIEEVACFGPDCFWLKISGVDIKLDKIKVPVENLQPIVDRLATCAPNFTLNSKNPSISTDSLNNDRVSITAPNYTRYYEFNIRRHYPGKITTEFLLRKGSTTKGFERWLDDIMECYPRIAITGDQAVGKTTWLRRIASRYPCYTVVGTIESSFELELSQLPNLIVKQLKSINVSPQKALEDSLRFGLTVMINGENRTGVEAATSLQAGQRSSKGTISTSHAPTAWDFIRMMVQLLVGDGIFTNEKSAMYYVINNIDFIIVPGVDNAGDEATGTRYMSAVYEIPSLKESEIDMFEPKLIFKAEKEGEGYFPLRQVSNLSEVTLNFLKGRNPSSTEGKRLERLRSYNYDLEND